jgi:hypothetical protein
MFVRSLDVLLTAVFLPVAFVGLIELLRKLGFVAGGSAIGVTAFIAVGWPPAWSPPSTSTPPWPRRPPTSRRAPRLTQRRSATDLSMG